MKTPEGYSGPELVIIERDIKAETVAQFVPKVFETLPADLKTIATFMSDKEDGELTKLTLE